MRDLSGVPNDRLAEALAGSLLEEVNARFTTLGDPAAPVFALGVDVRDVVALVTLKLLEHADELGAGARDELAPGGRAIPEDIPRCGCGEISTHPGGNCGHCERELADHYPPGFPPGFPVP